MISMVIAMLQLSTLLVAGVGLWLVLRGLRMLRAQTHHDTCGCGHAHGPTPAQVAQSGSLRDGLLVVAGIAARPCTAALFLLILTWRMEIFGMGILGAFAMGLGTAFVTVAVAGLAVWARRGSLALLPPDGPLGSAARWLPGVMQLAAGALIAIVSLMVLV